MTELTKEEVKEMEKKFPITNKEKISENDIKETEEKLSKNESIRVKFSATRYATLLIRKYSFLYDRFKRFWRYDESKGIWVEDAEEFIDTILRVDYFGHQEGTQRTTHVKEVINEIKGMTRDIYNVVDFDAPSSLIPFKNGVYDIKDDEFMSHHPRNFITTKVNAEYNPKITECPKIDEFFESLVGKTNKVMLYDLVAYCLIKAYPYQKMFFLHGGGCNGKTTFLNFLTSFVGSKNVSHCTPKDIIEDKFMVAELHNKLINIAGDIAYSKLKNTEKIKGLCGDEVLSAQRKFRTPFEFKSYAKLIFSSNLIPQTSDQGEAFYRRPYLIPFPYNFMGREDKYILNKITTKEELSGLAYVCVKRIGKMFERGWKFEINPGVEDTREEYERLSNPTRRFIDLKCDIEYEGIITVKEFKEEFAKWCGENHIPVVSGYIINREMKDLGMNPNVTKRLKDISNPVRCHVGISWKQKDRSLSIADTILEFLDQGKKNIGDIIKYVKDGTSHNDMQIHAEISRMLSEGLIQEVTPGFYIKV